MSEAMNNEMTKETVENTQQAAADVQNECTLNKTSDKEEKMFTQNQLREIIRERLQRERKVNEDLASVKNLLRDVSGKGLIEGSSYAEMAKDLVKKLEGASKEEVQENSAGVQEQNAKTPSVADEGGEDNADESGKIHQNQSDGRDSFIKTLSEIKAKYPSADALLAGDRFEKFAKGRSGSITEIFDDYYDFVSSFENSSLNKTDDSHSSLASTAFSSKSGVTDTGTNLTKQQMEIAKSAGMSYREYAHLLESIPQRAVRNTN